MTTFTILTGKKTIARHRDFYEKTADEHSFEAEEKIKIEDTKSLISKSNTLKPALKKKEDKLESLSENKKGLSKKKKKHFLVEHMF